MKQCPSCGKRKLKKNLINNNLECTNCNYTNSKNRNPEWITFERRKDG